MEHLSYLRKLYEYGETLSADELNEIVLYINTSIETINILIDREYAINNGHCEIRYKNSAQQPTKPSTGSNGYSDGWSATYTGPDTEHGEVTWMSICFLNGNGEYGVWSSPVRITWGVVSGGGSGEGSGQGRDGEPGAFKSRVFKRQNSKPARPVGGSYSDPVPPGWYDGIPQGLAIIWSSVCTFYGDGTSSGWSDPAQESDTANLDIEYSPRTDCPPEPMGDIPFSNHEAEGWYDPNSPNFNNYEMIWRAERKVSNGVYDGLWVISCIIGEGGQLGPPGKTGGHHESRYKNHQITPDNLVPIKPATGTDGTQNGWSILLPSLTGEELLNGVATFMSQCFVNEDGEYGVWTLPMRITGENGKDGEDGDEVEFIYTRRENEWPNPLAPFSPLIDDWSGSYLGVVWTDNPKGVSRLIPYEYVCLRNKINGTWYPYSVPAVWSKFGLNGRDGDGVEYVFIRTASDVAPTITNSDDTYEGKTYLDDDYLPLSSAGRCTDNPVGGNHNLPYEWVAKRSKGEPDIDSGARIWHKYSGTMSLWSTFTENVVRLDLDNENDSMLYSSSKGLVSGHVVTTGYLFDGLRDVSAYAAWSIYSQTGCIASMSGRTVTVTSMGALSGSVVVQAIYNGETYTATLTLKKIIDGDKYDLIIIPNAISYNNTTDAPPNTTVTVEIWRTTADGVRENIAPPLGTDGYSTYVLDGLDLVTSSSAKKFTFNVDNSEHNDLTVKISKGANSSEYLDCETIPICKATDGQSTFKSTMFVRMNNTPTKPANNKGSYADPSPSGCLAGTNSSNTLVYWEDGIPAGENMLWATSRVFTSTGLSPLEASWSTPRQMTDTASYDVEFAKKLTNDATPPAPTDANRHGSGALLIWYDPTNDPSEDYTKMFWRAEREKKNGAWGSWTVLRIKGEKGDLGQQGPQGNDGKDGSNGAQGLYEVKQYAISARLKSTDGYTMPNDCDESSWKSAPPMTLVDRPYVWQRTRMYNPATGGYSSNWIYTRLTGEIGEGQPGKTGLWYCYAGVWDDNGNGDVSSSSGGVTNTNRIGYYVKYGNNFYMNIKEDGANTNVPSTAPNSGWVEMQNDFKYIITKAVFSDYAQLGSFIVNGDWLISSKGTPNTDNAYSTFDPDGFKRYVEGTNPSYSGFKPNFAVDGKTGITYLQNAYIKGHIEATSGTFTNGTFTNGTFTNGNFVNGTFSGEMHAASGNIGNFSVDDGDLFGYNGSMYLNGIPERAATRYSLENNGGTKLCGLCLGSGSNIISDSDSSSYKSKAFSLFSVIVNTNSQLVLPKWPDTGWVLFIIPLNNTTVTVSDSSTQRILAGTGELVTLSEIGKTQTIYIKLPWIVVGGVTYKDCWAEWYSA